MDDLHYYTTFIKFGIGRATYDASQEIRNKHITREEAMALVKRFDVNFLTDILQRFWIILVWIVIILLIYATNLDHLTCGLSLMGIGN